MFSLVFGATEISSTGLDLATSGGDLARGAIAGGFVIGAAFLAGLAVMGRSVAALCALFMVSSAAALSSFWLGLLPVPSSGLFVLLQSAFAASVIVFLSASIGTARDNALLGSLMFAAALTVVGVGVMNIATGGSLARLAQLTMVGGVAFSALVALVSALRGDQGARLVLPGILVAGGGSMFALNWIGSPIGAQALFAAGVLTVAVVGATETTLRRTFSSFSPTPPNGGNGQVLVQPMRVAHSDRARSQSLEKRMRVSENQLAQVLDYSGIAVWDWDPKHSHQTASFCDVMGAESAGDFTPEAFRAFIAEDQLAAFDSRVYGPEDGGFDEMIRLADGRMLRMRGARAVDSNGQLERIVVFIEEAAAERTGMMSSDSPKGGKVAGADPLLQSAAAALAGAAVAGSMRTRQEAELADAIPAAIENGNIVASFQPIVSLKDKHVVGYEALLRWPEHPNEKNLLAEEIVKAAQYAGRRREVTQLMVRAAAEKIAEARKESRKPVFAAFNVSASEILASGFVEDVRSVVREFSLPDNSLVLEVTEAERINENTAIGDIFKSLKSSGVALAFDDFGAGFSCLSNLHKYQFDYIKIDKSFIDRMNAEPDAAKIVAALAGLGRDLGMKVIAEGIETKATAHAALSSGCLLGQGFHFGSPELPPAVVERLARSKDEKAALVADEEGVVADISPTDEHDARDARELRLDRDLRDQSVEMNDERGSARDNATGETKLSAGMVNMPKLESDDVPDDRREAVLEPVAADVELDENLEARRLTGRTLRRRLWAGDLR